MSTVYMCRYYYISKNKKYGSKMIGISVAVMLYDAVGALLMISVAYCTCQTYFKTNINHEICMLNIHIAYIMYEVVLKLVTYSHYLPEAHAWR